MSKLTARVRVRVSVHATVGGCATAAGASGE